MSKKITIIAAVLILVVLGFVLFSRYRLDSFDEVLTYVQQSRAVTTYFEKERNLRVGQNEKYKLFRISKDGFEELCDRMEPEDWKSEELFTTRHTGKVWILYSPSFPPFTIKWMKAHEKEAAAEVNRMIWEYRKRRLMWFLGILFMFLIFYGIFKVYSKRRLSGPS